MILIDVKNYLKQKSACNLQELSLYFQCEPEVMRHMLSHWVKKGVVVPQEKSESCGIKCVQCRPEVAQVYQYLHSK